ncbi:[citrate (pro-3S)-lyase] ligase [Fructilactobacillus cliffordii]|uniref:[Citrate [pro-3S]-lyase] ligase n=1 Tax=Fructilactobacillus cliffordii TaxID=2940299 RepID=A0A9Q9E1S0_9LACO|nr:[citrate (pro-3S)-lyase] ligase [Fructilactobacillus cliffordii]USS89045.1 [citrate (pro-3S)-lyase] ligase [Fructilactobacillus cliffordii]
MDAEIREMNLQNPDEFEQWRSFLAGLGIANFTADEVDPLDGTIGLFEGDRLMATGSYSENILKYIGVCHKTSENGVYFNKIVSTLLTILGQQGIFHIFVFTKPQYSASFQHVGFQEIVHSENAAFLETGPTSINDYLAGIPKVEGASSAIVMNANPFTLGHRYLVEEAARHSRHVYVFVVSTDKSLFNSQERLEMVKAGTADLENVDVVSGSDYLVSYATFPAYFLKSDTSRVRYQTTIDALIFKERIAPTLNITTRYLGTEPQSETTNVYNEVLESVLPPTVQVEIIPRKETDGKIISARDVRLAIKDDRLADLTGLVPPTTATFITEHKAELQARIRKGMKIDGN